LTNFAYDADGNNISEANASNSDQTTYSMTIMAALPLAPAISTVMAIHKELLLAPMTPMAIWQWCLMTLTETLTRITPSSITPIAIEPSFS
jgi:hypothetical protein